MGWIFRVSSHAHYFDIFCASIANELDLSLADSCRFLRLVLIVLFLAKCHFQPRRRYLFAIIIGGKVGYLANLFSLDI